MYERFTDRARRVMQLANQEAQRFNHEYIGTEHVLLGLIKEGSGVASHVLKNLGVDLKTIRLEVEKRIQSGPDMMLMDKIPQTPRTKKVIEYSIEESRKLNHNYVGTEHILLALCREDVGVGGDILNDLVKGGKNAVYAEVLNMLGCAQEKHPSVIRMAIEDAVANGDFEEAANLCDSVKKNTDPRHKEALRQITCVLLGHIKEDYGTKITLDAIKTVLDEYGI